MNQRIRNKKDKQRASSVRAITIAENVREARLAKGWTQDDLAQASGIAQPHICLIESGRIRKNGPDIHTIETIALALGVTISDILEAKP